MIRTLLFVVFFTITCSAQPFDTFAIKWTGPSGTTTFPISPSNGIAYAFSDIPLENVSAVFVINGQEWGLTQAGLSLGKSGFAVQGGAPFPLQANKRFCLYFDMSRKMYSYDQVPLTVNYLSFTGLFNYGAYVDLISQNNVEAYIENYTVTTGGEAMFTSSGSEYGFTTFPSGIAAEGVPPYEFIPSGTYNIYFNNQTLAYSFEYVKVRLIGPAFSGWGTDVYMETTDGNIYTKTITCNAGSGKFRLNGKWAINYGGLFPAGGEWAGQDIEIPAGTYTITFNREAGTYNFAQAAAIDNVERQQKVKMYPNPANDKWNFECAEAMNTITIYDVTGKQVYSETVNVERTAIELASFQSGIYLAKITSGDKVQYMKLIKQ